MNFTKTLTILAFVISTLVVIGVSNDINFAGNITLFEWAVSIFVVLITSAAWLASAYFLFKMFKGKE